MAGFIPYSYRDGQPEPWEYLDAGALGNITVGTALSMTDGQLALCSGATRPDYIGMYGGMVEAGQQIPVIRVHEETVFETELSVASAAAAVGTAYTIDTTGTMLTATTGGAAELVHFEGTEAGDKVRVRFIRA